MTIHITVALEGGCWFGHRSDRPGEWKLVRNAANGWESVTSEYNSAVAMLRYAYSFGPPGQYEAFYLGRTIASGTVSVP